MTPTGDARRARSAARAETAPTTAASSPAVRALLRWLPTIDPAGAFGGQHDAVHICGTDGRPGIHARVSLWWWPGVVHVGDAVGAPRGGLVPGRRPSYAVALPVGGYALVVDGVLIGWRRTPPTTGPVLRADGELFDPQERPYFRRDYRRMTPDSVAAALTAAGGAGTSAEISAVLSAVAASRSPRLCSCDRSDGTDGPPSVQGQPGWRLPADLVSDATTLRVLAGETDADQAAALLWQLSRRVWDPVRAGRALAAHTTAQRGGDPVADSPGAPITEDIVAQVAAQAVRWHGVHVVRRMPAWLIGWVMVAAPVLADLRPDGGPVDEALLAADRVRLVRVEVQWQAMAAARALIARAATALAELDDPDALVWRALEADHTMVDVRHSPESDEAFEGYLNENLSLREAVRRAYRCDARSWVGLFTENG